LCEQQEENKMDANGTPKALLWRGQVHHVTAWGVRDGEPFVETASQDSEFLNACLANMRAHDNHLTISLEVGVDFLADDPAKGQ